MVIVQRGQAQGPLIHSTLPIVPTETLGRKHPKGYHYPIRLSKLIRDKGSDRFLPLIVVVYLLILLDL